MVLVPSGLICISPFLPVISAVFSVGVSLGCVSSKDSSDTDIDTNIIDIDSIPDTLTTEQVDISDAVGSGAFKTAYNLKGQPDLLVVLLKPRYRATEIKKEIGYLKQLEALGIKTPRRYKKITFIDTSMPKPNVKRHGQVWA
jgi:hypothetical protein